MSRDLLSPHEHVIGHPARSSVNLAAATWLAECGVNQGAFCRTRGVVWRLAPDRVLVRRIGDHSEEAAADLTGIAAQIWLMFESVSSIDQLATELDAAGQGVDRSELARCVAQLTSLNWISLVDLT